jgi:L-rhamnose isomerase
VRRTPSEKEIVHVYEHARERYAAFGVDTEAALTRLQQIPLSLHCWQGDDVTGFEPREGSDTGGIQATGNYPGKARNADELRQDAEQVFRLLPGKHRFSLHAVYAETQGKKIPRNELTVEHFARWLDWAKALGIGLDFNPTCFAHPLAESGFTLSHPDRSVRDFWVEHCIACRRIGEGFGRTLGTTCITNLWIPDGMKDTPIDRYNPRLRLKESLDKIFSVAVDPQWNKDALEGKLFGIGSESYVVGSHEFYLAYAVQHRKILCLDMGHFHPTESVADKISAVFTALDEVLLHISRGVRWDSDHVVILSDEVQALAQEIVRHGLETRTHFGLDFFDASINRIAAWVIGARATLRALLRALLEPTHMLMEFEHNGNYTARLTFLEAFKTLPHSAVWDYYCVRSGVPLETEWLSVVRDYEDAVLRRRG